MGHVVLWQDGGKVFREADTMGCAHCQRVLVKRHQLRATELGTLVQPHFCANCGASVCHGCYAKMQTQGCRPWKQLIDRAWDRLMRRSMI